MNHDTLSLTIAAAFRHSGRDALKRNEIVYFLTFDRKWMSGEQANLLLKIALDRGLIIQEGEMLVPAPDIRNLQVPLGFKPDSGIFDHNDPVQNLIERIASATGRSVSEVVASGNVIIRDVFDGNLLPAAALVIVAKEEGVPYEDVINDLVSSVLKKKN
jgi:hypothetical protein